MIAVHLYGKLRQYAEEKDATRESVVRLPVQEGDTIGDVAARLGIEREEMGRNIFLNGQLSTSSRKVEDGDRLGLFPPDMSLLYRQYFPVHE